MNDFLFNRIANISLPKINFQLENQAGIRMTELFFPCQSRVHFFGSLFGGHVWLRMKVAVPPEMRSANLRNFLHHLDSFLESRYTNLRAHESRPNVMYVEYLPSKKRNTTFSNCSNRLQICKHFFSVLSCWFLFKH